LSRAWPACASRY